jgi:protein TonB
MTSSSTLLFGLNYRDISVAVMVHLALTALIFWGAPQLHVGVRQSIEITAVLLPTSLPDQRSSPERPSSPPAQSLSAKNVPKPEVPFTANESTSEIKNSTAAQSEKAVSSSGDTQIGSISTGEVQDRKEAQSFVAPKFDVAYFNNPKPAYPSVSRRLNEEGRVILRVYVDTSGKPKEIQLVQSSGYQRLDQAALEAVKMWRFTPAQYTGQAVAAWVQVPVSFQLRR